MPEFVFLLQCAGRADAAKRHSLPNELAAWNHAARDCAEVIRDVASAQQPPSHCEMTVSNAEGRAIFHLRFEANAG